MSLFLMNTLVRCVDGPPVTGKIQKNILRVDAAKHLKLTDKGHDHKHK
jgi:hypothetical protein